MQRVRRRRRELRATRSGDGAARGKLRIVITVDDVVRNAGMIWIFRLQLFEDIGGLELLRIGLVGGVGRFVERKCCTRSSFRRR